MKRLWMVLALVAGCEKNKPADTPPAATRPASDAAPTSKVVVVIEPTLVVVDGYKVQDIDGAIPRAKLDTLLTSRRGELLIAIAPDATYQRLVDVMDVAIARGLEPVLDLAGKGTNDVTPRASATTSDEPILLLTISTDAIFLGQDLVTKIADLPAGDDVPALRDAIAASQRKQVMLEADGRTRGDVLLRVLATARSAGLPDVKFLVQRAPSYPPPRKKSD